MTWYRSLIDTNGLPAAGASSAAQTTMTFTAKPSNEQRRSGFDLPVGHPSRERTMT